MRIMQFSDSFLPIVDGVGNVVFQYARNMGEKGHEVYVVAPQADTGYRGQYPFELVDYISVPLLRLKSYKVGTPLLDVHCTNRLSHIHAQIVHVHSPFIAGHAGISYAHKHNCPVVGTFHSKYYDDFLQATHSELLASQGARFVAGFYEKCAEVWTVSESSAQTLRSYGYEGALRVMNNGTDVHPLSGEKVRETAWRYGLDEGVPLLLYAGQINWKKNLKCVLEAASRLDMPFRLLLAGQGPHEREVARLARQLGIESRVTLTGHIGDPDQLNALYRLSSLFLFPSLYDTAGLVVREAAAMRTPSVVARGSAAAEGIRDGYNGYLCENDPADLARVIRAALAAPDALAAAGAHALETLPIPWNTLVDGVLENYRRIIESETWN